MGAFIYILKEQEGKSLGSLRHLSILILNEKHLSILVKPTALAVVCPPPTEYLAVVCPPPTEYLAVVAVGFGGHLYIYSLQNNQLTVNKQLTISKSLNFHSIHLCFAHL